MQVADSAKDWDLTTKDATHINDDSLIGLAFQRPSDNLIVQATEFCERFDGTSSLGRFAFDAREEWTIKLKQWDPNPAFHPPMDAFLGRPAVSNEGTQLRLWQTRQEPWPTMLRCCNARLAVVESSAHLQCTCDVRRSADRRCPAQARRACTVRRCEAVRLL